MKPHAPNLIRTLTASAKNERSPIVRKAYASAAAQVCKYASDKRLEKVVEEACAMYSQSDADADSKYVGGLILYELLKALPDTFSSIAAPLALPLAFGAKMDADDSNKEVAEIWSKVWEEGVSSEAAAIRLYAPNIVNVLVEGLTGPSWSRKRSCAEAVVQLCKTRGVEDVLQPHVRALLAPLMAELATPRLWEGKESILVALGAFCPLLKNLSSSFAESGSMRLEIVEASFSSAVNRKKASFRTAALTCLHDALESLGPSAPVPLQSKIFVKIGPPLLEACASYYDAKLDAANAKQDGAIGEETTTPSPWPLIESLNCLSLAFSNCSNLIEGQPLCESELKVKDVLVSVLGMPGITWQQSIAAFNACSTIVKTCSDRKLDNLAAEWSTKLLPLVVTVSRAANVHQARTVGLGCIIFLIEAAYNHNAAAEKGVRNDIRESLILFMEQEKSIDLKEKIDKAISLIP